MSINVSSQFDLCNFYIFLVKVGKMRNKKDRNCLIQKFEMTFQRGHLKRTVRGGGGYIQICKSTSVCCTNSFK